MSSPVELTAIEVGSKSSVSIAIAADQVDRHVGDTIRRICRIRWQYPDETHQSTDEQSQQPGDTAPRNCSDHSRNPQPWVRQQTGVLTLLRQSGCRPPSDRSDA